MEIDRCDVKHEAICHRDYVWEEYTPTRVVTAADLPSSVLLPPGAISPVDKNRAVFGLAPDKSGRLELEWYVYYPDMTVRDQLIRSMPLVESVPIAPERIYLYSYTDGQAVDVYITDRTCGHQITSDYNGYSVCRLCNATQSFRWDGAELRARNRYEFVFRPDKPSWYGEIPRYLRRYEKSACRAWKTDGRVGYYVSQITTAAFLEFLQRMPMPRSMVGFVRQHADGLSHLKWDVGWNITKGVVDKAACYGVV